MYQMFAIQNCFIQELVSRIDFYFMEWKQSLCSIQWLQGAGLEALLLGWGRQAVTGTWAERAAWLFVQLCRACELEAVLIPGFYRGDGSVRPGQVLAAHNHCWAGEFQWPCNIGFQS
jgi:hypothetical protein